MMQVIDQNYIRAIAELPDGFERLYRWIGQMIEDRDTAQAIAKMCVAQTGASSRRIEDDAATAPSLENSAESTDEEDSAETPAPDTAERIDLASEKRASAAPAPAARQGYIQPHARFAALERATAFLKARCVLVTPVDRNALIRKYRVAGKRDSMLLDEVVAYAIGLGMEP